MTEKVSFIPEGETEAIDFYIVEQERLAGRNYLLVTDSEEGDGETGRRSTGSWRTTRKSPQWPSYSKTAWRKWGSFWKACNMEEI